MAWPRILLGTLLLSGCGTAGLPSARGTPSAVGPLEQPAPSLELGPRVAAGDEMSCALHRGAMYCWGGQGYPPAPLKVAGSAGAVALAAAGARACVILGDGEVACFTRDLGGAELAPGIEGAEVLALGPRHACAALRDGSVWCWGNAMFGRIGRPTSTGGPPDDTPVRVAGLTDVVDLALGEDHSCALHGDGTVSCWGMGADPRVECERDGTETSCRAPSDAAGHLPRRVAGIEGARDIAAAGETTCAAGGDGTVWCWGNIDHDPRGEWVVERVPGITDAARITLGIGFGCALATGSAAGSVHCWGRDDRGQRGDGEDDGASSVGRALGIDDAVDVAAGDHHACAARRDGEVVCWGGNESFQIGDGTGGYDGSPWMMAIPGAVELDGGAALLCARSEDGVVQCLGHNDTGQLGDGTTVPRWDFAPVVDLGRTIEVDVFERHACAVSRRGELRCWGNNRRLYLGPSHSPEPAILRTPVRATWLRGIAEVATGRSGTCARTRGGRVSCFGRRSRSGRDPTHGPVPGLGRTQHLDGGDQHFCATLADGRVRCWGEGFQGQLGVDAQVATSGGDASHVVPGLNDVRAVVSGCAFSCALNTNRTVSCWGGNGRSQLGAAGGDMPSSPRPVAIAGVRDAVSIGAGCAHACARTDDGTILCWGSNTRGQLGTEAVSLSEDLVTLPARGRVHVLRFAICVDEGGGALRCFGEVPGVPERADRSAPTAVVGLLTAP